MSYFSGTNYIDDKFDVRYTVQNVYLLPGRDHAFQINNCAYEHAIEHIKETTGTKIAKR